MLEASGSKAAGALHCSSCGRSAGTGPNGVETVLNLEQEWCARCARIGRTNSGATYVDRPSPGRMTKSTTIDPLDAWIDCYVMTPKRRIKVKDARLEIQRAWSIWEGNKDCSSILCWVTQAKYTAKSGSSLKSSI